MENQEQRKIIVQKMKRTEASSMDLAKKYYSILSSINGLKLTDRELQLIAFTAIKGNISYAANREEFCSLYDSSLQTINNIIYKLKKMGVFIKEAGKIKVAPSILLNFENNVALQISLLHG